MPLDARTRGCILLCMDEGLYFGGTLVPEKVSASRRARALKDVQRVLEDTAPKAVKFQAMLIEEAESSDDPGMKKLGFMASEAILDRFAGKAAQEIRVGESEQRPIVFSEKLKVLKAGIDAAIEAHSDMDSPLVAFMDVVEGKDTEGVTI